MKGKLYLLPSPIDEERNLDYIPVIVQDTLKKLRFFAVEEIKSARRFIKKVHPEAVIEDCLFYSLNEHSSESEMQEIVNCLVAGNDVGILSEAGCPGIADPGADLVRLAHKQDIIVKPLPGPSAILLALMGSGMNGQSFSFNGYLPRDANERNEAIKHLEREALKEKKTQVFIETPYRNQALFDALLKNLHPETSLCIAQGLTEEKMWIKTDPVNVWRKKKWVLDKIPTVFCVGAY